MAKIYSDEKEKKKYFELEKLFITGEIVPCGVSY